MDKPYGNGGLHRGSGGLICLSNQSNQSIARLEADTTAVQGLMLPQYSIGLSQISRETPSIEPEPVSILIFYAIRLEVGR